MPRVCVFDVNEALLDLEALDPRFERAFGGPGTEPRKEWFNQLPTSWLNATVTDVYHGLSTLGPSALGMILDPLTETPDVVGPDLSEMAEHILEAEKLQLLPTFHPLYFLFTVIASECW